MLYRSGSKRLALLTGVVLGIVLGTSAVAESSSDEFLQGFTGSNGRGFTGSNGRGFTGSNGRGFTGSNGRGFTGSNGRGFTGSNGRGFTGSNGRGFTGSNGRSAVAGNGFAAGFQLAAMGAVDAIYLSGDAATLKVAGQTFSVGASDAQELEVGDYVVAGAIERGATAVVYTVGIPYVPGVSAVRIKAPIDEVQSAAGTAVAAELAIDYTPHLSVDPTLALSAGQSVEVVGTQPVRAGVLVVNGSGDGVSFVTESASDQEAAKAGRQ